ncbi:MAG TPA: site-2 protease family protein [Thermoanaerobacterales bacterium]|nr:site-2 protease family protein [Thermoanaerobacterales bacterium]
MFNFMSPDMFYRIPALLISITIHEFSHAKAADVLGDPTPRLSGRLTLNPIAHLDPLGLLVLWIAKFGWAKPVPVNPRYFDSPRRGMILVSLAGPLSNILLAFISLFILKVGFLSYGSVIMQITSLLLSYNLALAVFNLIPIPPLDGSKILSGVLPVKYHLIYSNVETYGPIILLLLIYTGIYKYFLLPVMNLLLFSLDLLTSLIINIIL